MRRPELPGAAVNAQRIRRWAQNFASYRHQITEHTIRDWIHQFDQRHQDAAARLLDVVDFYSVDRISAAFRTSLAALPGWNPEEDGRQGKWRFAGLSRSAGESADAMMHRFRIANGLDARKYSELFIHPSQILLADLGRDDTLVLVDDFVGTGDTVCNAWKESFAELVAGIGTIYLLVVAAISNGRIRVGEETSMTCVAGNELTAEDDFFNDACNTFSKEDKETVLRYCRRASQRQPKGYKECGLVLVFQHRCPNNALPVLHVDHERWTGLFPRHG